MACIAVHYINGEPVQVEYKDYEEYLKSQWWRSKRAHIIEAAGGKCVMCGAENNLHVHHMDYERIGHEDDLDLLCVCQSCHEILHHISDGDETTFFVMAEARAALKKAFEKVDACFKTEVMPVIEEYGDKCEQQIAEYVYGLAKNIRGRNRHIIVSELVRRAPLPFNQLYKQAYQHYYDTIQLQAVEAKLDRTGIIAKVAEIRKKREGRK